MILSNALYKKHFDITDKIKVIIPSVGDIIENEEEYYDIVGTITAMPIDFMVQLDDANIDFSQITEYDLFLLTFNGLRSRDTSLIFGDLDLNEFSLNEDAETGNFYLYDKKNDITIDYVIYSKIAYVLRNIHGLKKDRRTPGNEEARKYMLERARIKAKRRRNRAYKSIIEPLIISMVNTEQFKYDYDTVRDLTIYQFNMSVQQIIEKVDYDNLMYGVYAGTVDTKAIDKSKFNWVTHD